MTLEQVAKEFDIEKNHRFIKLLMFQTDECNFMLLYGFSSPTNQRPYPWRCRPVRKTHQYIWSAILTQAEAEQFEEKLTTEGTLILGTQRVASPQLIQRNAVLSGNALSEVPGPVSRFSCLTEFWNVQKRAIYEQLKIALALEGKALLRSLQDLFNWAKQECGIDFLEDGSRLGNYERYDLTGNELGLKIEIPKELKLQTTFIRKTTPCSVDLVVNCIAEHCGRVIIDQVKLFPAGETLLEFSAAEPMSRTVIRIWEATSGKLIFTSKRALIMRISIGMNYNASRRNIRDPWTDKLYASASNRKDIIKTKLESFSPSTPGHTINIDGDTYDQIDRAIDEGRGLLHALRHPLCKGAFIPNKQLDGEINSFLKIREYIEHRSVKKVVIADPFFSVTAAMKLLTRIPRTDVQIDIITSLSERDPDTDKETDICQKYRTTLEENRAILHGNLTIYNVRRGNKQVFHDRYLIRYLDDGTIDGFLLSNSLNSMGQLYPFVIAPLEQEVCLDVCEYLNSLKFPTEQAKQPRKEQISCDILFDSNATPAATSDALADPLPQLGEWLSCWYNENHALTMQEQDISDGVSAILAHSPDEQDETIRALSMLGVQTHLWPPSSVAQAIKEAKGAADLFLNSFPVLAKEREKRQNHLARGIDSEEYSLWALLNEKARPSRQGFHLVLQQAGHICYRDAAWLHGGYALLLELNTKAFTTLFMEIKSPLMFDVLALRLLFYPWNDELYYILLEANSLYLKLLCAEAVFYRLQQEVWPVTQLQKLLALLSPEQRSLQDTYLLSRITFLTRTSNRIQDDSERWVALRQSLLLMVANDLPQCTLETQETAIFWLYDCEKCSQCRLDLEAANLVKDFSLKQRLLKRVESISMQGLTDYSYDHDVSDYIDLYLRSVEALHNQDSEKKIFENVMDWHAFEAATEPELHNYNYQSWYQAYLSAKYQMKMLLVLQEHHPEWARVKKWIDAWRERLNEIDTLYNDQSI